MFDELFIVDVCLIYYGRLSSEKEKDNNEITDSMCGKFKDKEYIMDKFDKHIEAVKKYVAKDRLFIIDVRKDGYTELIEGIKDVAIKIPNDKRCKKFPKMNSKQEWNRKGCY